MGLDVGVVAQRVEHALDRLLVLVEAHDGAPARAGVGLGGEAADQVVINQAHGRPSWWAPVYPITLASDQAM
ncbi:hypothetical protein D3C86_2126680 [compost metagenome]